MYSVLVLVFRQAHAADNKRFFIDPSTILVQF